MRIAFVGLGKMGGNMGERLVRAGHVVLGYDPDAEARARVEAKGVPCAPSPAELIERMDAEGAGRRAVWIMVPAGPITESVLEEFGALLARGDVLIDGGNSNYKDTERRAAHFADQGLELVDAGTSGGVWGLAEGYSLMLGGSEDALGFLAPVLRDLAPAQDKGWGHVGPAGAGHFVKMIHNGIEYGMMQAYAEGFALLAGKREFELDLSQVAEIWRHGSVVRSWLLDLGARALAEDSALEGIAPYVPDSGEGRWTVAEAIEQDVAAPVITLALLARLRSRDSFSFSDRMLSALRGQFGGHSVKRTEDKS